MLMKEIRLIIFDLDGTLVDAYPAIIGSFNHTMLCLHYRRQSPRTICRVVGWGDANLLRPFIEKKDLNKALSIYRRHHKAALIRDSRLFPRAEKVLTYFKTGGYRLAVASNRPTRFSWILIRHLGLEKYFDYVLCADKLKYGKPHPEILKRIMQKFSLSPRQTLYIGDMAIDAQAGRRARVKTIIVTTGSSTKREIRKEKPYRILGSIGGLSKIL
jgi:phosphoglycolate phosphatase